MLCKRPTVNAWPLTTSTCTFFGFDDVAPSLFSDTTAALLSVSIKSVDISDDVEDDVELCGKKIRN